MLHKKLILFILERNVVRSTHARQGLDNLKLSSHLTICQVTTLPEVVIVSHSQKEQTKVVVLGSVAGGRSSLRPQGARLTTHETS